MLFDTKPIVTLINNNDPKIKNRIYKVGDIINEWIVCSVNSTNDEMTLFPINILATGNINDTKTYCYNYKSSPLDGWNIKSSKLPSIDDLIQLESDTKLDLITLLMYPSITSNNREYSSYNIWVSNTSERYNSDTSMYEITYGYYGGGNKTIYYTEGNDIMAAMPIITVSKS